MKGEPTSIHRHPPYRHHQHSPSNEIRRLEHQIGPQDARNAGHLPDLRRESPGHSRCAHAPAHTRPSTRPAPAPARRAPRARTSTPRPPRAPHSSRPPRAAVVAPTALAHRAPRAPRPPAPTRRTPRDHRRLLAARATPSRLPKVERPPDLARGRKGGPAAADATRALPGGACRRRRGSGRSGREGWCGG